MKNILLWVVIIGMSFFLFQLINKKQEEAEEVTFSELMGKIGDIKEVTLKGDNTQGKIKGEFKTGKLFETYGLIDSDTYEKLEAAGVKVKYEENKWAVIGIRPHEE